MRLHHSTMPTVLGIDLGGTKLAIARYDTATWQEREQRVMPTTGKTFPVIMEEIAALIAEFRKPDTRAIGIGVPGLVEHSGRIRVTPNIPGGTAVPLRDQLRKETALPVVVENDSSCFTLAEALRGAGQGHRVTLGVTMGTGVGGGIVIDGKLFSGENGFAAEFGHMLLRPGEPPRGMSSGRGEIEEYLSGTALRKRCPAAKNPKDTLSGPACAEQHRTFVREIAWMCANLSHCLDPGIIVFGGSAGRALTPHLSAMTEELRKWMLPGSEPPTLAIGTLKNAGTLGAALLAV